MAIGATIDSPFEVAVIGGGVVGLALITGLLHRGVNVKLYERQSSFKPIGAGIGFSPNALRALYKLNPKALEAQQKVTTVNGDPKNPNDWLVYLDGYNDNQNPSQEEEVIFKLYTGVRGFEGCVRAAFMNELLELIPAGVIEYGKSVDRIEDRSENNDRVRIHFQDGSTAEADAVIGCDGIKSRVRKLILGEDHPAAEPSYNHQYALRGLVPMDKAIAALGEDRARHRHMHTGPGSYVATVPVGLGKFVNLVAFIQDPADWPSKTQLTLPADKEKVIENFKDFCGPVRNLIQTAVDSSPTLDKWGIFDSVEHPAPTFVKGRVCVAGDAAHAASPHHGAGAGMGVEDNLVLAELLAKVAAVPVADRTNAVRAALQAYSDARQERTQWVAESSRVVGELFEWRYPATLRDWKKCETELGWRSHRIWDYDLDNLLEEAQADYERLLQQGSP